MTALAFRDINRTAGLLLIPYIAFLAFANALNFSVGKLNPGKFQALLLSTGHDLVIHEIGCLAES